MKVVPVTTNVNENGHVEVGGVALSVLADTYQTPLYVLDEETIRQNCRLYTQALAAHYDNSKVVYAGKANLNLGLINLIASEGLGLDVVSGGELYTALKSDVDPKDIYFHGNNKSVEELELAVEHGVTIVVDNRQELKNLAAMGPSRVLIRLKPGIEAHTHEYIKTGQIDSKFGFDLDQLLDIVRFIQSEESIEYVGLHAHIGSQIFDVDPFVDLVDILLDHVQLVGKATGLETQVLNLGGGIGIQYMDSDDPPEIGAFIQRVAEKVKSACATRNMAEPFLVFEPGRSIVGNAGVTVYRVGTVKEIPGVKTYLFVDGGMADNPRPMMYQAEYTFGAAVETGRAKKDYAIAGKFCESGDVLTHKVELAEMEVGDLLVVYATGAYNYAMASNYNRAVRPAMVLVNNGTVKEFVRRENWDDLLRYDQEVSF